MKIVILGFCLIFNVTGIASPIPNEELITFTSEDGNSKGQSVEAFRGYFHVTENRKNKHSRTIPIHYVRFPSTIKNPGPPIVYLAGGPGGSGIATAKHYRFELFMAMRNVADVIALDQRGTGASNSFSECQSNQHLPQNIAISDQKFIELNQTALQECLEHWQQNNVDVKAYNTVESVHDLNDLKNHLGVEKISLWGISYGSHLALAALKTHSHIIHKVIIASAEGLGQTIKYPARTDAYFDRLQHAFDSASENKVDIKSLMNRVHQKLSNQPVKLQWNNQEGKTITYFLQKRDMQQLASAMISDPARAKQMIQIYQAVDAGILAPIQGLIQRYTHPEQPISFKVMPTAMDLASGICPKRKYEVTQQINQALLAGYLNFSFYFTDLAIENDLDLGQKFRQKPDSDVPTLLISGTLDGRTYIESQAEAVSDLKSVTYIKVINAGHNLFKSSPKVIQNMLLFMNNQAITDPVIVIPTPTLD